MSAVAGVNVAHWHHQRQDFLALINVNDNTNVVCPVRIRSRASGNFTVMQKSSVAPTVSKERSAEYESLELLVENQAFLPRALQHPLNSRKAPTVRAAGQTMKKDARCLMLFDRVARYSGDIVHNLTEGKMWDLTGEQHLL